MRPEKVTETSLFVATRLLMQNETTMDDNPYEPSSSSSSTGADDGEEYSDVVWIMLWFLTLSAFILCPFIGSARRRELCCRRIRERRWIRDDIYEREEQELQARQRLQEREQRRANRHRQLQISKTQEDEIREQFLLVATEKYSKLISEDDIFESDHQLVQKSGSFRTPTKSPAKKSTKTDQDQDQHDGDDVDDDDIEAGSRPEFSATKVPSRVSTEHEHDDDEDEFMSVEDYQETNEVVRVPLPGQKQQQQPPLQDDEDSESDSKSGSQPQLHKNGQLPHRFVPNGCAICLSKFESDEIVTWSSNPNCSHVFHKECVIHWYLAVGKKTQQRRERLHPDLDEIQLLEGICKFPMLCPCCRQTFCYDPNAGSNKNTPLLETTVLEAETSNETTESTTVSPDSINGSDNNISTLETVMAISVERENEASC